jgi:hypothetical protein
MEVTSTPVPVTTRAEIDPTVPSHVTIPHGQTEADHEEKTGHSY